MADKELVLQKSYLGAKGEILVISSLAIVDFKIEEKVPNSDHGCCL